MLQHLQVGTGLNVIGQYLQDRRLDHVATVWSAWHQTVTPAHSLDVPNMHHWDRRCVNVSLA